MDNKIISLVRAFATELELADLVHVLMSGVRKHHESDKQTLERIVQEYKHQRKRIEQLENVIYMAACGSDMEGKIFCRYCLANLDEYEQGHKDTCVYHTIVNQRKKKEVLCGS